jgi:site-specific recombinase XerD
MEDKMISKDKLLLWTEQFMASIPHLAQDTRQMYRTTLLSFVMYIEKISNKKKFSQAILKQQIIAGWLKQIRTRYSLSTVIHWAGIMSRFFSFLEKNGYLQNDPIGQLQKKYPKRGLKGIALALLGLSPQKSLQSLKASVQFASHLGQYMQKFIALGRSQGKGYQTEESVLRCFDRFLKSYSDPPNQLSDSILRQWLSFFSNWDLWYRYRNFRIIRNFCLYLRRFDSKAYVPASSLCESPGVQFHPYIYSHSEIVAILKAVRQLKSSSRSPLRPHRFYLLILFLYTTGMRISEALNLQLRDIDLENQTLCIRQTKFYKSRLVPLSSSMMRELENYLQLRRRVGVINTPESYLFQNPRRQKPYSRSGIEEPFRDILRNLGLKLARGPRLHDLRATFAVHRLEEWYQQGVDVQSKLGLLSTYLGHVNIDSTQRYLPMTTELLKLACQRFEKYFKSTL